MLPVAATVVLVTSLAASGAPVSARLEVTHQTACVKTADVAAALRARGVRDGERARIVVSSPRAGEVLIELRDETDRVLAQRRVAEKPTECASLLQTIAALARTWLDEEQTRRAGQTTRTDAGIALSDPTASGPRDSGTSRDATSRDAGTSRDVTPPDAGTPDESPRDAGTPTDGASRDAASDAGTSREVASDSTPDAGVIALAVPRDVAVPDAGTPFVDEPGAHITPLFSSAATDQRSWSTRQGLVLILGGGIRFGPRDNAVATGAFTAEWGFLEPFALALDVSLDSTRSASLDPGRANASLQYGTLLARVQLLGRPGAGLTLALGPGIDRIAAWADGFTETRTAVLWAPSIAARLDYRLHVYRGLQLVLRAGVHSRFRDETFLIDSLGTVLTVPPLSFDAGLAVAYRLF